MEYVIICTTALLVSIVTLFSGFGLGTVLMPVFAIFFPLPVAIAATAVIHFANNIFKSILVGKLANYNVVLKFGIPAALAAILGAYLLSITSSWTPITTYEFQNHEFRMTFLGMMIGFIIIASALFELLPKWRRLSFPAKYIPFGGALSGFFGGLSGNQGIFRSAFLIKSGLNKEEFIGTGVICSIIVDATRLLVYGWATYSQKWASALSNDTAGIVLAASLTAFLGSYIGSKFLHAITFKTLQHIVGILLLILGTAIALGIL